MLLYANEELDRKYLSEPGKRRKTEADQLKSQSQGSNRNVGPSESQRSDDPGEKFETNADVVVGNSFKTWKDTDSLITQYINNSSTGNAQKAANQLSGIIGQQDKIRNKLFPLNRSNWVEDGEDEDKKPKYKLKLNH